MHIMYRKTPRDIHLNIFNLAKKTIGFSYYKNYIKPDNNFFNEFNQLLN